MNPTTTPTLTHNPALPHLQGQHTTLTGAPRQVTGNVVVTFWDHKKYRLTFNGVLVDVFLYSLLCWNEEEGR